MASTPNTQAINVVNQLVQLAQQLYAMSNQVNQISATWTNNSVANTLASFGTVAQNADGTLGTADGSPVVAHPFNPVTYNVGRAISSNQVAQLLTVLQTIPVLVSGSAVGTVAGITGILSNVSS